VGEPIYEPRLGDVLHPGADQGNDLPGNKEAEVAVAKGAKGLAESSPEAFGKHPRGASQVCGFRGKLLEHQR
jgi:hypothetical protein